MEFQRGNDMNDYLRLETYSSPEASNIGCYTSPTEPKFKDQSSSQHSSRMATGMMTSHLLQEPGYTPPDVLDATCTPHSTEPKTRIRFSEQTSLDYDDTLIPQINTGLMPTTHQMEWTDEDYDDTLNPQSGSKVTSYKMKDNSTDPSSSQSFHPATSFPAASNAPVPFSSVNEPGKRRGSLPAVPKYEDMVCQQNVFYAEEPKKFFRQEPHRRESLMRALAPQSVEFSRSRSCSAKHGAWILFGLIVTAAFVGGSYFITKTVVGHFCGDSSSSHVANGTVLYGEIELSLGNDTWNWTDPEIESQFLSDMKHAIEGTILSAYLKRLNVLGVLSLTSKSESERRVLYRFAINLNLHTSLQREIDFFVRSLLEKEFVYKSSGGAILRCVIYYEKGTCNDVNTVTGSTASS